MNFDEEAREIMGAVVQTIVAGVPSAQKDLESEIYQALRRAFIAGQEDMRERAAHVLNDRMFETSGAEYGLSSDPERAYQRNFNAIMQTSASAIRSLAALSGDK